MKSLKTVMAHIYPAFGVSIQGLKMAFMDILGFEAKAYVEQVMYYIENGWFYEDLEDLEKLLYFLLHTNAKRIHLSYA